MKNNTFFLPMMLIAVLFVAMLTGMILQICLPPVILPPLNVPNIVLLSVVALLLDHYIAKGSRRCYISISLFAIAAFALLPLVTGFAGVQDFWKIGLIGGVIFTAVAYLFTSAVKRLKTGPKAPAAPVLVGFGIYLAFQCFAGILL